jgi:hypothetical protein
MRYVILIYDTESATPSTEAPPAEVIQQVMDEYNRYTKMLKERGAFQAGEALQPVPTATSIRQQDGRNVTTDGPFAETKEALGGFYLVEARDLDEALELGAACPGVRYGATIEVRPVIEYPADHAEAGTAGTGPTA